MSRALWCFTVSVQYIRTVSRIIINIHGSSAIVHKGDEFFRIILCLLLVDPITQRSLRQEFEIRAKSQLMFPYTCFHYGSFFLISIHCTPRMWCFCVVYVAASNEVDNKSSVPCHLCIIPLHPFLLLIIGNLGNIITLIIV